MTTAAGLDRLAMVETILETIVKQNQALEDRVQKLEYELQKLQTENSELKTKVKKLKEVQILGECTETDDKENFDNREAAAHNKVGGEGYSSKLRVGKHVREPGIRKRSVDENLVLQRKMLPAGHMSVAIVAFTAHLSHDVTGLGVGQAILFDHILTNVGGGYHSSHGNFVAPTDGVYVFSLTAAAVTGTAEFLNIVKDGSDVAAIYVDSQYGLTTSSAVLTLQLATGNEVWVKTASVSHHGRGELHALYTSFSGWLLA